MKQSFLPRPLLFKEWKEYRWWLIVGAVLMLYGPFSSVVALSRLGQSGEMQGSLLWRVLIPVVYHVQFEPGNGAAFPASGSYVIHGQPAVNMTMTIVAMGLLIALVTVERNRGNLRYTLSFPIRRIDVLRVKIVLAVAIVLGGLVLDFLLLLVCDLATHQAMPVTTLFAWLGMNLLISLTMMAIGLASAVIIQIGFIAGLAAILAAAFPWALGLSVIRSLPTGTGLGISMESAADASNNLAQGSMTAVEQISTFLRSLSPVSHVSGSSSFGGWSSGKPVVIDIAWGHPMTIGLVLWFLFIIVAVGLIGIHTYLHAPIETSGHFIQFPRLFPWFLWLVCGAVSFFLVNAATGANTQLSHTPYVLLVYWIAVWLAFGLIMCAAAMYRNKRRHVAE